MYIYKAMHTVFYIFYVWFNEIFSNDLDAQNLSLTTAIRIYPDCKIQLYCIINIFLQGYPCGFRYMELSGKN